MYLYFCSTIAVRRMGLTVAPSLSNTSPATPAVSPAWTGLSSPHCPCHLQSSPDPPTSPNPQGGAVVTAPPAHPMTHPSTSAPQMRCATVASGSPTCPHTMRTRRWRCHCPPSEAPCWERLSEAGDLISTPTPEPSAQRCDHPKSPNTTHTHKNPSIWLHILHQHHHQPDHKTHFDSYSSCWWGSAGSRRTVCGGHVDTFSFAFGGFKWGLSKPTTED